MGLFSKKSPKEKLQKKYEKLMKESYVLSKSNRKASDQKVAEAEEVLKELNIIS
ncbi:Lacal_2735 family protein [Ekhidna sp.]|uniref:Lacal_2735 family protein n=1 Tax=Ekhidna sp. TaxID=2608089 RepID=UPI00329A07DB